MNKTQFHIRLAEVIRDRGDTFTADDVTDNGRLAFDDDHGANARQNGIGALFNKHAKAGHIEFTGNVTGSLAPKRKGGAIRIWRSTEAGRRWADRYLWGFRDDR